MSAEREEIERQLAEADQRLKGTMVSLESDMARYVVLLGHAIIRLDKSVENLDKSSSRLARINIWLTVSIAILTAAMLAAAIVPLFRK